MPQHLRKIYKVEAAASEVQGEKLRQLALLCVRRIASLLQPETHEKATLQRTKTRSPWPNRNGPALTWGAMRNPSRQAQAKH